MPAPVPHPRCGKVYHRSRKRAEEARNILLARIDAKGHDRASLEVYRCRGCGGFHIGNNTPDVADHKGPTPYKRDRKRLELDEEDAA